MKDFVDDYFGGGLTINEGGFSSSKSMVCRVLTETTLVVLCDRDN